MEINGLLTAILSGTHLSSSVSWMQLIGIKDLEFASKSRAGEVKSFLMNYYSQINTDFKNKNYKIPIKYINREAISVFKDVYKWANTYLQGTVLWEKPSFKSRELSKLLIPVTVFADESAKNFLQNQCVDEIEGLDGVQWVLFAKLTVSVIEVYKIFNLSN